MTTGMMLPVAEAMDRAGFDAIELISSSHLKKCVRELKEDPWARVKLVSQRIKNTPLRLNAGRFSAFDITPRSMYRPVHGADGGQRHSRSAHLRRMERARRLDVEVRQVAATSASIRYRISSTRYRPNTPTNISPSARARPRRSKSIAFASKIPAACSRRSGCRRWCRSCSPTPTAFPSSCTPTAPPASARFAVSKRSSSASRSSTPRCRRWPTVRRIRRSSTSRRICARSATRR